VAVVTRRTKMGKIYKKVQKEKQYIKQNNTKAKNTQNRKQKHKTRKQT